MRNDGEASEEWGARIGRECSNHLQCCCMNVVGEENNCTREREVGGEEEKGSRARERGSAHRVLGLVRGCSVLQ